MRSIAIWNHCPRNSASMCVCHLCTGTRGVHKHACCVHTGSCACERLTLAECAIVFLHGYAQHCTKQRNSLLNRVPAYWSVYEEAVPGRHASHNGKVAFPGRPLTAQQHNRPIRITTSSFELDGNSEQPVRCNSADAACSRTLVQVKIPGEHMTLSGSLHPQQQFLKCAIPC